MWICNLASQRGSYAQLQGPFRPHVSRLFACCWQVYCLAEQQLGTKDNVLEFLEYPLVW